METEGCQLQSQADDPGLFYQQSFNDKFYVCEENRTAHYVAFASPMYQHGINTQNVRHVMFDIIYEFKYTLNMIIILALCIMVLHVFKN